MRHVTWSPIEHDAARSRGSQAFGDAKVARPRLSTRPNLIVGLRGGVPRPSRGGVRARVRRAAARPSADDTGRPMSRFVQLEGRLTLTGANADRRIRVRDSHLAAVAAALANELVVVRQVGPLAAVPEIGAALAPYAIDAVAKQAGIDVGGAEVAGGRTRGGDRQGAGRRGRSRRRRQRSGPGLELAAIILNMTIGAFDAGLFDATPPRSPRGRRGGAGGARRDMAAGVDLLIVAGVNSVMTAAFAVAKPGRRRQARQVRATFADAIGEGAVRRVAERPARRDQPAGRRAGARQPPVRVLERRGAAEGRGRRSAAGHPAALRHPRPARRPGRVGRGSRRSRGGGGRHRGRGGGQGGARSGHRGAGPEHEGGLPLPAGRVGCPPRGGPGDARVRGGVERRAAVPGVEGARWPLSTARLSTLDAPVTGRPGAAVGSPRVQRGRPRASALPAPGAGRRPLREQRLAPRTARSDHADHVGRRALDCAPPVRRHEAGQR